MVRKTIGALVAIAALVLSTQAYAVQDEIAGQIGGVVEGGGAAAVDGGASVVDGGASVVYGGPVGNG